MPAHASGMPSSTSGMEKMASSAATRQVARAGEHDPAADAPSVDADDRHGADGGDRLGHDPPEVADLAHRQIRVGSGEVVEVEPGAERPAGAGDADDLDVTLGVEPPRRLGQLDEVLPGERVEPFGPMQLETPDRSVDRDPHAVEVGCHRRQRTAPSIRVFRAIRVPRARRPHTTHSGGRDTRVERTLGRHARDRRLRRLPALLAAAAVGDRRRRSAAVADAGRAAWPATTRTRRRWASRRPVAASPPCPTATSPGSLAFATTDPAYVDKTNATAIHAALGLPDDVPAFDAVGAIRSGVGAAWMAQAAGGLAVLADIRTGRPGSSRREQRRRRRRHPRLRRRRRRSPRSIGSASVSAEFIDRWRMPGRTVVAAVGGALRRARLRAARRAGGHRRAEGTGHRRRRPRPRDRHRRPRACRQGRRRDRSAPAPAAIVDDLTAEVGNTGHRPLGAAAGRRARPRRTGPADRRRRPRRRLRRAGCCGRPTPSPPRVAARTVRDRIAATRDDLAYAQFLTWRGHLRREPPRRPEPERPASPPSARTDDWKYGFVGSRDENGFVHLPPSRVSMGSGEIDRMEPVRMADVPATIATFTVDRLAYSLSPPVVAAIIDFDGGGRFQCELTDVDPASVAIGDRVEMTFRRLFTQRRHPQLLLEGPPAVRCGRQAWSACRAGRPLEREPVREGRLTWHHTGSATRSPSSAWAARRSASTGTARPTTCSSTPRRTPWRRRASPSTTSTRSGSARWARACPA